MYLSGGHCCKLYDRSIRRCVWVFVGMHTCVYMYMWKEESFAKGGETEMADGQVVAMTVMYLPTYLHDFMSVSGVVPSGSTAPPQRGRRKKSGVC